MAQSQPGAVPPVTRPVDRYGRPPRRLTPTLRRWLVAGGLAVAVGLTALLWVGSRTGVDAGVTRLRVVSDHRVDITFEVHKAPTARAVCVVRARDANGAQTGYEEVTVGPTRRDTTTVTWPLRTRQRAVTGEVVGCRLAAGG